MNFSGIIDQDTDPRFFAEGNYLYALNVTDPDGSGRLQNMRSSRPIPYTLPQFGTSTVICAHEDTLGETVIIFLRNSLGNHRILRYSPLTEIVTEVAGGSWLNFANKIHSVQVVDGDLLYWVDGRSDGGTIVGEEPKKLRMSKGTLSQKNLRYKIIAGYDEQPSFANGRAYTVSVRTLDGVTVIATETFIADGTHAGSPKTGLEWMADEIAGSSLSALVSTIRNLYELSATMVVPEQTLRIVSTDPHILIAPDNHYATPISSMAEQVGQLSKQPPTSPPTATYFGDSNVTYNNVKTQGFQFRTRFIYDDDEASAWSAISMPGLNASPSGIVQDGLNAIRVDFTDPRLADPAWLSLIRHVEVAVREGNDEPFRLVRRVPISEMGTIVQSIVFYNDQTYSTVPSDDLSTGGLEQQFLGLSSNVPRVAGAVCAVSDERGNSRLVLGATLEGYDCPTNIDLSVTSSDYEDDGLVDIIGTVRVINAPEFPGAEPEFEFFALNGFVVYLAGTQYFGVSKNKPFAGEDGSFIIRGVPRGKYSIRVASYLCKHGEDNEGLPVAFPDLQTPLRLGSRYNLLNGIEWQKTSSPCIEVAGSLAAHGLRAERVIDLRSFVGPTFDLDTEVGFGPVDIQNAHREEFDFFGMFEVYAHDRDGLYGSLSDRSTSLSVENIRMDFHRFKANETPGANGTQVTPYTSSLTDHNGYAWALITPVGAVPGQLFDGVRFIVPDWGDSVGNENPPTRSWQGTWTDVLDDTATERTPTDTGSFNIVNFTYFSRLLASGLPLIVLENHYFCGDIEWHKTHRTNILGKCIDQTGVGLPGVLAWMVTNGRYARTNQYGEFSLTMHDYDGGSAKGAVQDLYVTYEPDSAGAFTPTPSEYTGTDAFDIDSDGIAEPIDSGEFAFPFAGGIVSEERFVKSGGIYKYGIVYEDEHGRSCGVVPVGTLRVPFHTDEGTYLPKQMRFSVQGLPPIWAHRYRIVRTKNAFHLAHKHIPVGEVIYARIPFSATQPTIVDFDSNEQTHILLRIETKLPPDTVAFPLLVMFRDTVQSGYRAKFGDRVRYVLDEAGNAVFGDRTLEVKVDGEYVDGEKYYVVVPYTDIFREVKQGWLFEFLTPKTFPEEIYYETGVSLPILSAGLSDRRHKGITQDEINGFGAQPATGPVLSGDTYWRLRSFSLANSAGMVIVTENQSPSEEDDDIWEDIGRARIYDPNQGEVFHYNRLRISGLYVPDSLINNLSSFGTQDFQHLNRLFGPIKWASLVHNVMLCVCEFKAQPVYVAKDRLLDLSGQSIVGRTAAILNIADETVPDAGTVNPESIVVEDGRAYWWDERNGKVWRYGGNGVQDISTGLSAYFRQKGDERKFIISPQNIVHAGYDRVGKMYALTFTEGTYSLPGDGGSANASGDTVMFREGAGWKTFLSRTPNAWGRIGNQMLFWIAGNGHIMYGHPSSHCVFASVASDAVVKFVVNQEPFVMKDWKNLRVLANRLWEATLVEIAGTTDYPSGMATKMPAGRWRTAEGAHWADFLRDMRDPHAEFLSIGDPAIREAVAATRGRFLKGEIATITLRAVYPLLANILTFADTEWSASNQTR